MKTKCMIEHQLGQPTLSIRFRAPATQLSEQFGRAYGAVGAYLGKLGLRPAGPAFATYHNMDVANLDVEAGFPVERAVPGHGEIVAGKLDECEVATCIHTGPYDAVGASYSELSQWLHGRGLNSAGLPSEFYLNDPTTTPTAKLQTKIVMPVEPA